MRQPSPFWQMALNAYKKLDNLKYTPSPAEAEFDGLTTGFETIQLCP
jgi:hypothetical protein